MMGKAKRKSTGKQGQKTVYKETDPHNIVVASSEPEEEPQQMTHLSPSQHKKRKTNKSIDDFGSSSITESYSNNKKTTTEEVASTSSGSAPPSSGDINLKSTGENTYSDVEGDDDTMVRSSEDPTNTDSEEQAPTNKTKKAKTPGIIYLSSIPDEMQYLDALKVFSELGEIGRVSLQVGGPQPHHTKKKRYSEGWVEFLDKKKAKRCVALLNNQLVGGKKKSKWYDCIWHMKYLPKFQWIHLTERLAYEQASTQQRMRTEITQARREAQHFAEQIEWRQKELKMASKHADWKSNKRKYEYTQRVTDDEIRKRKVGSERVKKLEQSRSNVLGSLFGSSKPKS